MSAFLHLTTFRKLLPQTSTVKNISEMSSNTVFKKQIQQLYYQSSGCSELQAAATIVSLLISNNTCNMVIRFNDLRLAISNDPNHLRRNTEPIEVVIDRRILDKVQEFFGEAVEVSLHEDTMIVAGDCFQAIIEENLAALGTAQQEEDDDDLPTRGKKRAPSRFRSTVRY
jgi:hypothetical protein